MLNTAERQKAAEFIKANPSKEGAAEAEDSVGLGGPAIEEVGDLDSVDRMTRRARGSRR